MIHSHRHDLPSILEACYLNTGTAGPIPLCTTNAMHEGLEEELREGRVSFKNAVQFREQLHQLRVLLANLVNASPNEIAITQNTTNGINIVLWGYPFQPGDEILTTTFEHMGPLAGLSTLFRSKGVDVQFYDPPNGTFDLEQFLSRITQRTRLIVISHVSYLSGLVIPIQEICHYAHQQGIQVLVDGAQAVGSIPVDLQHLQVDFYAFPAQKWLLGPEGLGALYVKADSLERLQITFAGYFSFADHDGRVTYVPKEGSERFESGLMYRPAVRGWIAGLNWLSNEVGWELIYQHIQSNTELFREMLMKETSYKPVVQGRATNGLVAFDLPSGISAEELCMSLVEEDIYTRFLPRLNTLRVSIGFFNNREDFERLFHMMKQVSVVSF